MTEYLPSIYLALFLPITLIVAVYIKVTDKSAPDGGPMLLGLAVGTFWPIAVPLLGLFFFFEYLTDEIAKRFEK